MPKNNRPVNRLNSKGTQVNKSGLILIGAFVLWVILLMDMLFVAHNDPFIIIFVSLGIWAIALVMIKPGKFARSVQQNGFWKTLFGSGSNQERRRRRR